MHCVSWPYCGFDVRMQSRVVPQFTVGVTRDAMPLQHGLPGTSLTKKVCELLCTLHSCHLQIVFWTSQRLNPCLYCFQVTLSDLVARVQSPRWVQHRVITRLSTKIALHTSNTTAVTFLRLCWWSSRRTARRPCVPAMPPRPVRRLPSPDAVAAECAVFSGACYLILGHGSRGGYKDVDAALREADEVGAVLSRAHGAGSWMVIYGGDRPSRDMGVSEPVFLVSCSSLQLTSCARPECWRPRAASALQLRHSRRRGAELAH